MVHGHHRYLRHHHGRSREKQHNTEGFFKQYSVDIGTVQKEPYFADKMWSGPILDPTGQFVYQAMMLPNGKCTVFMQSTSILII